jgi:DnaB-like helicase N terminal domain
MSNDKLKVTFKDCSDNEKGILDKYWTYNADGNFPAKIKRLCEHYGMEDAVLRNLANQKSELIWDFGICSCGNEIKYKILKRRELTACLTNEGHIEHGRTSDVAHYFTKCKVCRDKENEKLYRQINNQNSSSDWDPDYSFGVDGDTIDVFSDSKPSITERISKLSSYEKLLLIEVYRIKNFNVIKTSSAMLRFRSGDLLYKRFWATLFKFDKLDLLCVVKASNSKWITDLSFYEGIENEIKNLSDTILNQSELESSFSQIHENSEKIWNDIKSDNPMSPPTKALKMEQIILGSLMLQSKEVVRGILSIFKPENFSDIKHGVIYSAILQLYKEREPIDMVTVVRRLRANDLIELVGGAYYIAELTSTAPNTDVNYSAIDDSHF